MDRKTTKLSIKYINNDKKDNKRNGRCRSI